MPSEANDQPTGDLPPDGADGGAAGRPPAGESSRVDPIGEQIGPYRLLSRIGEGGFGVVYLAERREPMVQRVALKVIKPGMDTRAVVARFEQERQALAVMDHPNVARVLDGGVTPAGLPFFVMEYVKGEPITAFADRNRLTITERLSLFVSVCEAVQHAHMKGIIHRDIKPSNILVASGGDGHAAAVKVIDFGVAKAVSHTLTDKTIFTEQGQIIGTPEYMSPEQAEMGATDIDTRTDVYSLGVVLYELLSGTLPFEAKSLRAGGYAEIQRIIREVDPPKPSTKLSSADRGEATRIAKARQSECERIAGELRRELEWIPLKALRKDRARRYASAESLAADVRRYLAGDPLEAGPESTTYRLSKLLHRHRGPVAAAVAVALALVGGIGGTTWQWFEANAARTEAERARDAARASEKVAVDSREEEQRALIEARKLAYSSTIRAAEAAWRFGDVRAMRRSLEASPADYHDWEHGFLMSESDRSDAMLSDAGAVDFAEDGSRVWIWSPEAGKLEERELPSLRALRSRTVAIEGVQSIHATSDSAKVILAGRRPNGGICAVAVVDFGSNGEDRRISVPLEEDGREPVEVVALSDARLLFRGITAQFLVDVASGGMIAKLDKDYDFYSRVAVEAAGGFFAMEREDKVVSPEGLDASDAHLIDLRRLEDGALVRTVVLPGPVDRFGGGVASLAYMKDGRLLVGRQDGTLLVLRSSDSSDPLAIERTVAVGSGGWVRHIRIHPDGQVVAAGTDSALTVFDLPDWKARFSRQERAFITSIEISDDGESAFVALEDRSVVVCGPRGDETANLLGFHQPCIRLCSIAGTRAIAGWGADMTVRAFLEADSPPYIPLQGARTFVDASLGLAPDIALGASAGGIHVWNARSGRTIARLQIEGSMMGAASAVASIGDSRQILAASIEGGVFIGDALPDDPSLVMGGIRMAAMERLEGADGVRLRSLQVGSDGSIVAGMDFDGKALLFRREGRRLETLAPIEGTFSATALSGSGRLMALAGAAGIEVRQTQPELPSISTMQIPSKLGAVTAMAIDERVERLVFGTARGAVGVWSFGAGSPGRVQVLEDAHGSAVTTACIAASARRFATGSQDRTVRVFDIADATELIALRGFFEGVKDVRFSDEDMVLWAFSGDGTIRAWSADPDLRVHRRPQPAFAQLPPAAAEEGRLREAEVLNRMAWDVVRRPGSGPAAYAEALGRAKRAAEIASDDAAILNTLAFAHLRAGNHTEAVAVVGRIEQIRKARSETLHPTDLACIGMAHLALHGHAQAQASLEAMRQAVDASTEPLDPDSTAIVEEAEKLRRSVGK